MRALLLLSLFLPILTSVPRAAWGVETYSKVKSWAQTVSKAGRWIGELVAVDAPEERCREEEVNGDLPEGVHREDCRRTVCGGNFWGESALDVCCVDETVAQGDEVFRQTYLRCFARHPSRPASSEPWIEVQVPVEVTIDPDAGESLLEGTLLPLLLPSAHAITELQIQRYYSDPPASSPPPPEPEWSFTERSIAADILREVAANIRLAFIAGQLGEPETDLRRYAELAYSIALWGRVYFASPVGEGIEDACPSDLPDCCFDADELEVVWDDVTEYLDETNVDPDLVDLLFAGTTLRAVGQAGAILMSGGTGALAGVVWHLFVHLAAEHGIHALVGQAVSDPVIQIPSVYKIETNPDMTGVAVIHAGMGISKFMFDQSGLFRAPVSTDRFDSDRPISYADDTTALIVGSILYSFLPPNIFAAANRATDMSIWARIFQTVLANPANARILVANELVGEAAVGSGLSWRQHLQVGLSGISGMAAVEALFQRAGGLYSYLGQIGEKCSTTGCPNPDGTPPDNDHNEVGSLSSESECEGSEDPMCASPDCTDHPEDCEENPDETGADENDPDWEDPDNRVPDCVPFYDEWIAEGRTVGADCYRECWNQFPSSNGNLCDAIKFDDLESGCTLSGDSRCAGALKRHCYENPNGLACMDLCRGSNRGDYSHCWELCRSNLSENWADVCGPLCSADPDQPFCRAACGGGVASDSFCERYCDEVDSSAYFCGTLCERNSDQGFCVDRCESSPTLSYCGDLCDRGDLSDSACADYCGDHAGDDYCERRAEEKAAAEKEKKAAQNELTNCRRGTLGDPVTGELWPFVGTVCTNGLGDEVRGGPRDSDWVGCHLNGSADTGWGVAPNPEGSFITGSLWDWSYDYADGNGYYCLYVCWLQTLADGWESCWCVWDLEAALSGACYVSE